MKELRFILAVPFVAAWLFFLLIASCCIYIGASIAEDRKHGRDAFNECWGNG